MKFIHLSDLHIGKTVNGFSMAEDQRYILEKILEIIKEQKADAVLIAGDIYDNSVPSAEAVSLFNWFLSEIKINVFVISGNHDSAVRLAFGQSIMNKCGVYFSPVFNGEIEPIIVGDEFGEIGVYLIPFMKPALVREKLGEEAESYEQAMGKVVQKMQIDTNRRNIALVHQFLTGAEKSGSEEMSIGALENIGASIFDKFDYVALGHIHRAQKVERETVRYCGSPLKYSFSEIKHKKSVTVVNMEEKGKIEISQIPLLPLRDMREIRGRYDEITLKKNYENTNTHDYLRIVLEDEIEVVNALGRLRSIYPNIMELRYSSLGSDWSDDSPQGEKDASPAEIFGEFYRKINGTSIGEEQSRLLNKIIEEVWEGRE